MSDDPWRDDRPVHHEAPAGRGRSVLLGMLAVASIGAVGFVAWHRASPPARCPVGLAAMGARCCGIGQRLEGNVCLGRPDSCGPSLEVSEGGCVARSTRIAIAAGTLRVLPTDWEAAQAGVMPREAEIGAFLIDSHEVSEAAWGECVAASACASLASLSGEPGRPVIGVTAEEAAAYCRHRGGSLPTRDQWMMAASGPEGRRYPWGNTGAVCRRATFGVRSGPCADGGVGPDVTGAHPDGATPEGVHDLAGNAAEWARGEGAEMVVVGGSFEDMTATDLRTWNGHPMSPVERSSAVGLRCVYPQEETR
ncbi:MAG: SUMF1/EgtB/PvdO family nonheme iron enzyme [Myxococcales bacterium]|nr:SUMF1/EgtB/PvdO family nonheme iron enzyme [Myxococcales bacterium]